jgi:hypothetical protein
MRKAALVLVVALGAAALALLVAGERGGPPEPAPVREAPAPAAAPVAGVNVTVEAESLPPDLERQLTARTARDGSFTLSPLPAGFAWTFRASLDGDVDATAGPLEAPAEATLRPVLKFAGPREFVVEVREVGTGAAVAGAEVRVDAWASGSRWRFRA